MVLKLAYIDNRAEYIEVKKVTIRTNSYDGIKYITYTDIDGKEYQLVVGRPHQNPDSYTVYNPDYYAKLTSPEPIGQAPMHIITQATLDGEEIYNFHKRDILKG